MPKERSNDNKGLPERWVIKHGAYYYRVPPGMEAAWDNKKWFRLGSNSSEAYKAWSKRLEWMEAATNIDQLLDRYALEVIPEKSPATQGGHFRAISKIRVVFGPMGIGTIKPMDIYQYNDRRGGGAAARIEINVLSHALTKAVEWGYIETHPFKGQVRLKGGKSRTRYVEDWEIDAALNLPVPDRLGGARMIQAYIALKLLIGLRQTDMLQLREQDIREDGIHVTPSKTSRSTGKKLIFEWSPDLKMAVEAARAARPLDISPLLFCTRYGDCFYDVTTGRAESFASIWQRFMDRLLAETDLVQRFAERDLRAKASSDAESDERASEVLGHSNTTTTRRFYRRKPSKIKPLK